MKSVFITLSVLLTACAGTPPPQTQSSQTATTPGAEVAQAPKRNTRPARMSAKDVSAFLNTTTWDCKTKQGRRFWIKFLNGGGMNVGGLGYPLMGSWDAQPDAITWMLWNEHSSVQNGRAHISGESNSLVIGSDTCTLRV